MPATMPGLSLSKRSVFPISGSLVDRPLTLACLVDRGEHLVGVCSPDEWLGVLVGLGEVAVDGGLRSWDAQGLPIPGTRASSRTRTSMAHSTSFRWSGPSPITSDIRCTLYSAPSASQRNA